MATRAGVSQAIESAERDDVGRIAGREAELARLEAAYARATAGVRTVTLVVGEPGLGKSALLGAFAPWVADRGATVLRASGAEDETSLTFGILDQLAAHGRRSPDTVDRPPDVLDPISAGVDLLANWSELAATAPLVLLIDDAGWADEASLLALSFALRRLADDRVLAVIACRDTLLDTLPVGLRRLVDGEHEIVLAGLDGAAFASLLRSVSPMRLSTAEIARVCDHTGGNPLHALTLARELGPDLFAGDPLGPLPVPRSIGALVHARVAALDADANALVAAASVLGSGCALSLAAKVGDVTDQLRAAAATEAAGVLRIRTVGGERVLAFDHPLTRSAIYHDLDPLLVAALHARAARLVTDAREELHHRVAACPGTDDELADEVEAVARDLATTGAWFTAARWLEAAASVSTDADARDRRTLTAEFLRIYGGMPWPKPPAEALTGDESAHRLASAGASLIVASKLAEGEALLRQAWAKVDPKRDVDLAVRIAVRMSDALNAQLRANEASTWAARAYHLLPEGGVVPGEDPLNDWIYGLVTSGHLDEALATAAREVPPRGSRAVGLLGRGFARMISDDLVGALDDLRTSFGYYERVGPAHKRLEAEIALLEAHFRLGDWDRALLCGSSAYALAEELDITMLSGLLLAMLATLFAAQGQFDTAERLLEQAQAALVLKGSFQAVGLVFLARARMAAARGDARGVVDALATLDSVAGAYPQADEQMLIPWRVLYGAALAEIGNVTEARAEADHLTAYAARREVVSAAAGAARLRGLVAAAEGQLPTAIAELTQSTRLFGAIPVPLDAAVSEFELGRVLTRLGDPAGAARHLGNAAATFARIGAVPYHDRARAELEACGSPVPTGADRRAAALRDLTPAEAAVAHLVAEGKTNREAAAALVLSVRTIEHHLGRVYAKLGVSSRGQMIALLAGIARQDP